MRRSTSAGSTDVDNLQPLPKPILYDVYQARRACRVSPWVRAFPDGDILVGRWRLSPGCFYALVDKGDLYLMTVSDECQYYKARQ